MQATANPLPAVTNPLARTLHQQKVDKFMRLAGQELPDAPCIPSPAIRELRARIMLEEMFELIQNGLGVNIKIAPVTLPGASGPYVIRYSDLTFEAKRKPDLVEIVDGVCDVKVTSTGTLSACGVSDAYPQDLVDENNLAKFDPNGGGYRRDDGKWIKGPNHQPPDIVGAINLQLPPDAE